VKQKLTNQQAYDALIESHVHWDRKDSQHIIIWTSGYKTADCMKIETFLMQAGMRCVKQEFDKHCGKTFSIFKHK
jgi:hypothetical protein